MANDLDTLLMRMKSAVSPARQVLRDLHTKHAADVSGTVADYIPELAKANPEWFGISVVSVDGQVIEVGDFEQTFTIQSISKPFVYGLAFEDHGREEVLTRVGVEPSGEAFNSIVLDQKSNRPFNPMVNAGAIATADLIGGKDLTDRINRLVGLFHRFTGHEVHVDSAVFMSSASPDTVIGPWAT